MAFVATSGSVRELSGRLYPTIQQRVVLGGFAQDYLQIWRTQGALRSTVTFLARNVAQLGLPVFRRNGDTERERLYDHPLAKLIRQPNPWTTRYRFLNTLMHDVSIFDRSYWLKSKTAGQLSLIRLDPVATYPMGGLGFYPEFFEFRGLRATKQYPADQVFFLRGYAGGTADTGGVSPIESLRDVLEESYYSAQSRSQTMRNGARISGYLKRPPEAVWSDTAKTTFKEDWQAQYSGNGPAAGGTPILEDGMDFVPAAMTPKDLQYVESRKLTREEVAAAYFIPPPMLGLLENATFSNIVEQHQMLYSDTLGPTLSDIQDEIVLQLVPDLPDADNVYAEFNLAEKLKGNFEQRQAAIQVSTGAPWLARNEARALDNYPPIDDPAFDVPVQPLNTTQPGDPNPVPAEPAPPPAAAWTPRHNGHRPEAALVP